MKIDVEEKIWISRMIDAGQRVNIKNPILASILMFGLPVDVLMSVFLTVRKPYISPQFFWGYIFCVIWLNIGPYFIWRYEQIVMTKFFKNLLDLLQNQETQNLEKKYRNIFTHKFWVLVLPWAVLVVITVYSNNGFIFDIAGTFGFDDVWSWLLLIPILWVAFIAGMGTWGVITTILAIHDVSHRNLKLDPLHIDKRGGLGCIGDFAINTTILISSGSLFLPLAFQFALELSSVNINLYLVVVFYVMFILLSFIYPVLITHAGATVQRDKLLEKLRKKYNQMVRKQISIKMGERIKLEYYTDHGHKLRI